MARAVMLAVVMAGMLAGAAHGGNFRVETDVFMGKQKEPICQTLTLFTDAVVYDFINDPQGNVIEVTAFDMSSGRVILLNPKKAIKTVLTYEQLLKLTTSMKVATSESDEVFYFASHPKFDVSWSGDQNEVTLAHPTMTYKASCVVPQDADAAPRYREFADWSARINACRPGGLPPFARLELNREIADQQRIPLEIERTIVVSGTLKNKKLVMTSRHLTNWLLSEPDRRRITTVAEQIATFETVSFERFTEAPKPSK